VFVHVEEEEAVYSFYMKRVWRKEDGGEEGSNSWRAQRL